jgi:hypothetical protein
MQKPQLHRDGRGGWAANAVRLSNEELKNVFVKTL